MARWDEHPRGSIACPRDPHWCGVPWGSPSGARAESTQPREGRCGMYLARRGQTEDKPMFYEVRTYTLRPGTVAEFEERYAKRLPLRGKHSKLGAFWHTEVGPLNQVIHVYPYEDLQQRVAVREAMAQDTALQQLPGGRELILAQESEIMTPARHCQLNWQALKPLPLPKSRGHF